MAERRATVTRETSETQIEVTLDLDGGRVGVETGVPFFDHMLDQLGRHGRFGLAVAATGDLEIDAHHTVEDVGIALGEALTQALADKRGIARYGHALVPMEECLAEVALDISGRPLLVYDATIPSQAIGQFDVGLTEDFLQALARAAGLTLHVTLRYGRDAHHAVEAMFKALARALGEAVSIDPRSRDEVPSTKGIL
ncbi:MAG TPA: imidazoleglycerol-phosphate dehydratase HisB [Actinomycetota bacterium]|nr:imidazoleglycerol-phosphate dehydratase HisB [Actinomycetota bacterium]